jgi:signal transduction histidine kinase
VRERQAAARRRQGRVGRGQQAARAPEARTAAGRIEAADRIRADLIGTVSHEFRTPLTSIRAAALTLRKRGDRLDDPTREAMWKAILDGEQRLSRLLENMLVAATARNVDPEASTAVDAVAAEVAMVVAAKRGSSPVSVLVEPGPARAHRPDGPAPGAREPARQRLPARRRRLDAARGRRLRRARRLADRQQRGQRHRPHPQGPAVRAVHAGEHRRHRDREGIGVGLYVVRRSSRSTAAPSTCRATSAG